MSVEFLKEFFVSEISLNSNINTDIIQCEQFNEITRAIFNQLRVQTL